MKKRISTALIPVIAILILSGCSTGIHTSWTDPFYKGKRFSSLTILALSDNPEQRMVFESNVSGVFNDKGVSAIPAYTKLKSDTSFKYYQFEMKFDSLGVDAILIFRLLSIHEEESNMPDPNYFLPQYYFNYYTYYYNHYNLVNSPGYVRRDDIVKIEASLYSNRGDMLVWTAQTSTIDPASVESLARSLGKTVFRQLKRKKLI